MLGFANLTLKIPYKRSCLAALPDVFIFVYGSLRRSAQATRHELLAGASYCADGYLYGKLYRVDDGYPGAVESTRQEDKVFGELYRIADNSVLARLDDYEECGETQAGPHEYLRKRLPIQLGDGTSIVAWVYLYNRDTTGLQRIMSGDFVVWQASCALL
ncbi:MAG: gamma-glutamylcyclotransferase family protein [Methylovulum sp.]|nr:gamma-glutamylcyclotransferase family protein [Methylovulum sp.]